MPHPLLFAAGLVIILGTGYLIMTEFTRQSHEEEWHRNYCAMIKAEDQETIKRRKKSGQNQEQEKSSSRDSHTSKVSTSLQAHTNNSLRERKRVRMDESGEFPLIDLGHQSYPPTTTTAHHPSSRIPTPLSMPSSPSNFSQVIFAVSPLHSPSMTHQKPVMTTPALDKLPCIPCQPEKEPIIPDSPSANASLRRPLPEKALPSPSLQCSPSGQSIREAPDPNLSLFESTMRSPQANENPTLSLFTTPQSPRLPTASCPPRSSELVTHESFSPTSSSLCNATSDLDETWSDLGSETFEHA